MRLREQKNREEVSTMSDDYTASNNSSRGHPQNSKIVDLSPSDFKDERNASWLGYMQFYTASYANSSKGDREAQRYREQQRLERLYNRQTKSTRTHK